MFVRLTPERIAEYKKTMQNVKSVEPLDYPVKSVQAPVKSVQVPVKPLDYPVKSVQAPVRPNVNLPTGFRYGHPGLSAEKINELKNNYCKK